MSVNVKENSKILALSKQKITIKTNKFKKFGLRGKNESNKKSHFARYSKKNFCNLNESEKFRISVNYMSK